MCWDLVLERQQSFWFHIIYFVGCAPALDLTVTWLPVFRRDDFLRLTGPKARKLKQSRLA